MAITWIFGQSGAGKTTLAYAMQAEPFTYSSDHPYYRAVVLDGDEVRKWWPDMGYSKRDRWKQNIRVANIAKFLDANGVNVVVSLICPYKKLRKEIKKITNCKFIYIEGDKEGKKYPFEKPKLY